MVALAPLDQAICTAGFRMQFELRSKECALADLTDKYREMPLGHPERATLARMIVALRAELAYETKPTKPAGWR